MSLMKFSASPTTSPTLYGTYREGVNTREERIDLECLHSNSFVLTVFILQAILKGKLSTSLGYGLSVLVTGSDCNIH